jgi:hypothetical protein
VTGYLAGAAAVAAPCVARDTGGGAVRDAGAKENRDCAASTTGFFLRPR